MKTHLNTIITFGSNPRWFTYSALTFILRPLKLPWLPSGKAVSGSAKFSGQESRVLGSMMALSQTRGMTSEKASWPFFNVCHICAIKPLTKKLRCFSPRWGPTSHSQRLTLCEAQHCLAHISGFTTDRVYMRDLRGRRGKNTVSWADHELREITCDVLGKDQLSSPDPPRGWEAQQGVG